MLNENPTPGAIDLTYLSTVSGGDKAFEAEMLQSLGAEIDQRMQAVKRAADNNDKEDVRLQAHSLKNLFAMLGLPVLQNVFYSLEAACLTLSDAQLRAQVGEGELEWAGKKTALDKILADYGVMRS